MTFVSLVVLVVACSPASAFVYWDNYNYAIGRSALDGSQQVAKFASLPGIPCGVATDGHYAYWADHLSGTIGRAPIDGIGAATDSFITGLNEPCGVAVYDHHIYWANNSDAYDSFGSIGRASLTGPLDVRPNFVPNEAVSHGTDLAGPCGVAVDATGIYWGDQHQNAIGRANLDGTGAGTIIHGASSPCGVALVAGHILWANTSSGTIGEAWTNGAGLNESLITGQYGPCGLTTFGGYLYWTSSGAQWGGGTVSRVALNSANPTADAQTIVMSVANPCGVAVDGLFNGIVKLGRSRPVTGGVKLQAQVSAAGTIRAKQASPGVQLVRTTSSHVSHPGTVTLHLSLTGAGRRSATQHRHDRVELAVTFQPSGGIEANQTTWIVLR